MNQVIRCSLKSQTYFPTKIKIHNQSKLKSEHRRQLNVCCAKRPAFNQRETEEVDADVE